MQIHSKFARASALAAMLLLSACASEPRDDMGSNQYPAGDQTQFTDARQRAARWGMLEKLAEHRAYSTKKGATTYIDWHNPGYILSIEQDWPTATLNYYAKPAGEAGKFNLYLRSNRERLLVGSITLDETGATLVDRGRKVRISAPRNGSFNFGDETYYPIPGKLYVELFTQNSLNRQHQEYLQRQENQRPWNEISAALSAVASNIEAQNRASREREQAQLIRLSGLGSGSSGGSAGTSGLQAQSTSQYDQSKKENGWADAANHTDDSAVTGASESASTSMRNQASTSRTASQNAGGGAAGEKSSSSAGTNGNATRSSSSGQSSGLLLQPTDSGKSKQTPSNGKQAESAEAYAKRQHELYLANQKALEERTKPYVSAPSQPCNPCGSTRQ
jgi:hypothetical protein